MEVKIHQILQKKLKGQNLSKVARDLGIPKQRLHDWVEAKRYPNFKNATELWSLAEYLGLSFEELIFGEVTNKIISSVTFEDDGKVYKVNIEKIERNL